VSRLSRQCGILNISQPYRPPRHVTGIALLYVLSQVIFRTEESEHHTQYTESTRGTFKCFRTLKLHCSLSLKGISFSNNFCAFNVLQENNERVMCNLEANCQDSVTTTRNSTPFQLGLTNSMELSTTRESTRC
jgi:hypothetical protein